MSIKGRIGLVAAERKWLNEMATQYHYMHKPVFNKGCPFGWAVTWDGEVFNDKGEPYGFIIYSSIHFTKLAGEFGYSGLPTHWQVLSLSRLWLHDDLPRNSETYVIARTLRMVQRRWLEVHPPKFPNEPYHIRKVVSYSDTRYHTGTIYRAANFRELKRTRSPNKKNPNRGSGQENAELICFVYDLKEPNWCHESPVKISTSLPLEKEDGMIQMPMFESVPERIVAADMAMSASFNQDEILRNIMRLHNGGEPFDADVTYSKGAMWKRLPKPRYKFDLTPQTEDCQQADARQLPLGDESLNSIMFDPPFIGSKSNINGIIKNRFTSFATYELLWEFYHEAMVEFFRVLRPGGLLTFKCQDSVSSGENQWSTYEIQTYARAIGYKHVDTGILLARTVLWSPNMKNQKRFRKNHSYFLVFRKPNGKSKKSTNR